MGRELTIISGALLLMECTLWKQLGLQGVSSFYGTKTLLEWTSSRPLNKRSMPLFKLDPSLNLGFLVLFMVAPGLGSDVRYGIT